MNKILKSIAIPISIVVLSIILGIIFRDSFLGIITLIFGFLNAYYLAIGKWYNYIFGILFSLSYGWICAVNGLFGWGIAAILFYIPSQILGIITWFKNKQEDVVLMRSFNVKKSFMVCSLVILASIFFGFLLSLIPTQKIYFLDATTQIVNVCGIVLSLFRYRESWYVWLLNNVLDLYIWIINFLNGGYYVEMMLITSIMYLIMNIIGIIYWIKTEAKQSRKSLEYSKME